MNHQTTPTNLGTVVSVRGSVVDIRFDSHLPAIYTILHAGTDHQFVVEILAQRDSQHVRGIALTPREQLPIGRPRTGVGLGQGFQFGGELLFRMVSQLTHDRDFTGARTRA